MSSQPRLVLSMVVHNEADRYLRRMLMAHRSLIDAAVIIDDASTDNTAALCRELLSGIPLHIVRNEKSSFSNEVQLRKQQWAETIAIQPQWILNLDADEIMEEYFAKTMEQWLDQDAYHAIYFRLYDMWDENHYREDRYWKAHSIYRPFLVRYLPEVEYAWQEIPQHCGRFPLTISSFPHRLHPARIRHYGWASLADRQKKYSRYQQLDPGARYGWSEQYASILDPNPTLISWEEIK